MSISLLAARTYTGANINSHTRTPIRRRIEIGSHASTAPTISCQRYTQRVVISINFIVLPDELQFIFRRIDVSMSNGRIVTGGKMVAHTRSSTRQSQKNKMPSKKAMHAHVRICLPIEDDILNQREREKKLNKERIKKEEE